jgi:1-deoxy-D-xylulose-5-phosphate synthase
MLPKGHLLSLDGQCRLTGLSDVGIAEQHGVTFAAGMAASGLKRILPVQFAIDRAGLVGATLVGAFDIGFTAALPNMTVMAAADEAELAHMVATAVAHDSEQIAFRCPRGEGEGLGLPEVGEVLEICKAHVLQEGSDVTILSFGAPLGESRKAVRILEADRL